MRADDKNASEKTLSGLVNNQKAIIFSLKFVLVAWAVSPSTSQILDIV